MLDTIYMQVLDMSKTASIVILAVLLVRLVLKKVPKGFSYALWAVVLFRLLCPFSFETPVSVVPEMPSVSQDYTLSEEPISVWGAGVAAYQAVGDALNGGLGVQHVGTTEKDETGMTRYVTTDWWSVWILFGQYVWAAGMAAMLLYSAVSYRKLRRQLLVAVPLRDNIFIADDIKSPFVVGLFRPKIYLPCNLGEREQEYIILHEQHHIKRFDHIAKLLAFLALTIHWFNPLVWLAFVLASKDMEMSCDEAVIRKLGSDVRADYSASLLTLATGRRIIAGTPLAFGEGDTKGRILNLAKWKKPAVWVVALAVIACVIVAICLLTDPNTPEEEPDYLKISSLSIGTDQEIGNLTARLELVELLERYEKSPFRVGLDDPNDTSISIHMEFSDGSSCLLHYYFYDGLSLTKLTSGEGYYRSVLTYWNAEGAASAWEFHENFNYKFIAWYNKWKTPEPVLEQTAFSDILGCSGYVITDNTMEFWSSRDYIAVIGDQQFLIANTFGFGDPQDYVRDLDGDGVAELIANVQFGGDGHAMVYVYQRRGDTIYQGTLSFSDLPNHDDWGANSTYSEYDPESGVFRFHYAQVDSEEYAVLETDSLSDFAFVEFCVLSGESNDAEGTNAVPASTVAYSDLDHDRVNEEIMVRETDPGWLYELSVVENGTVLWSKELSTAHAGWGTIMLYNKDGSDYLVEYYPYMNTGFGGYTCRVFSLRDDTEIVTREWSVQFKTPTLETDEMKQFAREVGVLLRNCVVLLSTERGILVDQRTSASALPQIYPVRFNPADIDAAINGVTAQRELTTDAARFPDTPLTFLFASGMGGWGTTLTLCPDGSFTGSYSDADMGAGNAEYPNGTYYVCDFSGRFTDIQQINDDTWLMKLSDLTTERPEGEVWVENQTRYIASEPHGLTWATEFLLYAPGTLADEILAGARDWWPDYFLWRNGTVETLNGWALCNVSSGAGFFTSWLNTAPW